MGTNFYLMNRLISECIFNKNYKAVYLTYNNSHLKNSFKDCLKYINKRSIFHFFKENTIFLNNGSSIEFVSSEEMKDKKNQEYNILMINENEK